MSFLPTGENRSQILVFYLERLKGQGRGRRETGMESLKALHVRVCDFLEWGVFSTLYSCFEALTGNMRQ